MRFGIRQVEAIAAHTTLIDLFNPKSNTTIVDTRKGAESLVRFTIHFDDRPGGAIRFTPRMQDWTRLEALGYDAVTITQGMKVLKLSRSRTSDLFKSAVEQEKMTELAALTGRARPAPGVLSAD